MVRRKQNVWVAVVDGARARIYAGTKPLTHLQAVPDGQLDGSRALTHEITTDRPGHTHESVGGARHSMGSRSDPHQYAETQFAKQTAAKLKQAATEQRFDKLVIVAAPHTLGDLRSELGSDFRKRHVCHEIAGDWTKMSASEVVSHLQNHLNDVMASL